jgi:histidinol phosphatase-like PHP family hydrolase
MENKVKANLHMHSLYSDGHQWPCEMVVRGKMIGLDLIALTDHDTMEGVEEFLDCCKKFDIKGIAAVEIDCVDEKIDFDMELLAYFPDGNYEKMVSFLRERLIKREKIIIQLIENGRKLFKDETISFIDFKEFKMGFSHEILENKLFSYIKYNLFQYFISKKALPKDITYKEFKTQYYKEDKLGNLEEKKPQLSDLAKMIKESGGFSVLPHPPWILDGFDWSEKFIVQNLEKFDEIFKYCHEIGIWGIEMNYYKKETDAINKLLLEVAQKYDFGITYGSDCHGRGSEFCNLENYSGYFKGFLKL